MSLFLVFGGGYNFILARFIAPNVPANVRSSAFDYCDTWPVGGCAGFASTVFCGASGSGHQEATPLWH